MQLIAIHHMVLHLVMVLISMYLTIQIKTQAVVFNLIVLTICQQLQVKVIQY
jgi:hypothetical protein